MQPQDAATSKDEALRAHIADIVNAAGEMTPEDIATVRAILVPSAAGSALVRARWRKIGDDPDARRAATRPAREASLRARSARRERAAVDDPTAA